MKTVLGGLSYWFLQYIGEERSPIHAPLVAVVLCVIISKIDTKMVIKLLIELNILLSTIHINPKKECLTIR